ncbi:MAG: N-acetylglucosamine-6-phosphate deacetylase [Daejeonella sp.]
MNNTKNLMALSAARIFTGAETLHNKTILIDQDKIKGIVDSQEIPSGYEIINFANSSIAPGLIDLQVYGSGGKLFGGKPTVDALQQMESDFLKQGCTGFMATVATNSTEIVLQAIESAKLFRKQTKGAFLGLHLEGPFLNSKKRGAHPENLIRKAILNELKEWINSAQGEIKIITIAPELQDMEVIEYLLSENIIISAGHSNATFTEAEVFFKSGIQAATHLFNAMPQIHHREPGLATAIFKSKPFASIIADGVHVSYPMIDMAKELLGEKLFLITDAVTETNEGIYPHIFKEDRYVMPDGTLSGSCLSMFQAVRNCVKHTNIQLDEALRMASTYPSNLIQNQTKAGYIKADYPANLVVFNEQLTIENTCVAGVLD